MNRQMQQQFENAMAQALLFEIVIGVIGILITFTLLYWVIRLGVRDGMKDANQELRRAYQRRTPELKDGLRMPTPDMRAD
jgi:uncharacterized membrane protein YdjX (TVP38/TMEM64 family)